MTLKVHEGVGVLQNEFLDLSELLELVPDVVFVGALVQLGDVDLSEKLGVLLSFVMAVSTATVPCSATSVLRRVTVSISGSLFFALLGSLG